MDETETILKPETRGRTIDAFHSNTVELTGTELVHRSRAEDHGGVVDGCIRGPRSKTSYDGWFFWQASSTEQLDQSNLIIFHAYTV